MKTFIALLLCATAALSAGSTQPWTKQPIDPVTAVAPDGKSSRDIYLTVSRSTVLEFKPGFRRISVTTGDIAEAVAVSSTELLLNGKSAGDTSLIIWDTNGGRAAYVVHVTPDEKALQAIRDQLKAEVGPDVTINVQGNSVFLRGTVSDPVAADRAVNIASTLGKVVNLLRVLVPPREPQILLKVRFASLDRSLATQLGINLFALNGKGVASSTTGQFGQPPQIQEIGSSSKATITDLMNLFYFRPDINLGAVLKDLEAKNVLQILAEPNVLATSGHPASFLAGGEFPFPTIQGGAAGVGQITVQFREFGIRLQFVPTITPRGSIHLMVEPEVSTLDYANALTVNGFTVPGLSTRRIETQIELENNQSFAIAGLLNNSATESFNKLPGLASIPILGKFFQSKSVSKSQGELIVTVTPELVQPIAAEAKKPELETPYQYLPGKLPSNLHNPVDPATARSVLGSVPSLPVEQIKALSAADAPAPPQAAAPVMPLLVAPTPSPQVQQPASPMK